MQVSQILKDNVKTFNKPKTNNVKTLNVNGNDVKRIAHYLAEKLDDYRSVNFFCSVAWQIPESQLMIFLENTQKPNVRNPRAVFTWQCNQQLRQLRQGNQV
jgi:hypothetical protein